MAHVLLPCDLPSWPDIQRHLALLKTCRDGKRMAQMMDTLYDICCVSLDPDDAGQSDRSGHPGISELCKFVEEVLSDAERTRFLKETLPNLISRASDLKRLKPPTGFLYSLKKEEGTFQLERAFMASLLANAFFSTFPKRNAKTHPTLQDFRMADFFAHLAKRSHQKKLKAFLRYFENLDATPGGYVKFTRKVVSGPSLPGWLCSDRPLVPLILRPEGNIHDAESQVYRACSCAPLIGGDVLRASTSKEARLFFSFPELLVILSFVESLTDEEALIAENTGHQGHPVSFCFLDSSNFSENSTRQFEDKFLLRELNKALAAFLHDPESRPPSSRSKNHEDPQPVEMRKVPSSSNLAAKMEDCEIDPLSRRSSGSEVSNERRKSSTHKTHTKMLEKKRSSQNSSRSSMRTASQSSVEPLIPPPRDDDYYTADDDSEDGSRSSLRGDGTDEVSVSRSNSMGFVLGESEDSSFPQHERLDDFRKRIRKRTRRRLSRRSSRSSYLTSSGSSDMEDISEDPEEIRLQGGMRPASSEPSIVSALSECLCSPLSQEAETALLSFRGKKMMVTSSNGHLKAYSYDGVNPNLPVPFKAKFRRRRHHSEEGGRSVEIEELFFSGSTEDPPLLLPNWGLQEERKSSTPSLGSAMKCFWNKRHPVAVEPCCGDEEGDSQLKVTIMWLAASMADIQALILYTLGQSQLHEVSTVYGKVLSREWTVGDLSCEVLRFCRNRLYPRRKSSTQLFGQIIGRAPSASLSQESLD